jgi:ferredoxin
MQQQESTIFTVTFLHSDVTAQWTSDSGTLLELAEAVGVDINFGCRYGDCATCQTELISGEVAYLHPTGAHPDPGTCLPCSCRPEADVVLDA